MQGHSFFVSILWPVSRYHSYINTARQILGPYKGEEPFPFFLKKFFSADKKYGSRDRKTIAHLCYCYFRLGKSMPEVSIEEKILIGLFFCSTEPNDVLQQLKPEWNAVVHLPVENKCSMLHIPCAISNVFPWKEELSEGIDHEKFCESFFFQPDVYLRMRPGHEEAVKQKLSVASIAFREIDSNCLSVTSSTKIDQVLELDKEAVVQDYNSQKTGEFIKSAILNLKSEIAAWDCCAGSGGKSLLLYDIAPQVELTVSDARTSIIQNLKKRFAIAGIKKYTAFVADLTGNRQPTTSNYNLIICDAPCTGSGVWSRTPEQLYFFDDKKIDHYSLLQKKIISNTISHLNPGGYFLYITCSVFKKENEEKVEFMQKEFGLDPVKMDWLRGYDKKADSLFAALLKTQV